MTSEFKLFTSCVTHLIKNVLFWFNINYCGMWSTVRYAQIQYAKGAM